jgi:hypothetical protein
MHILCEPLFLLLVLFSVTFLHICINLVPSLINSIPDTMQQRQAAGRRDVDQLPIFRFNGDNRLEFLSGWPDVCAHFGFRALLLDEPPIARPVLGEDDGNLEQVLEWDRLNELAKSKIKNFLHNERYLCNHMGR